MQIQKIGDCLLYCADCKDILPKLTGVDAVVTDPPYGIEQDKGFTGKGLASRRQYLGGWDQQRPSKELFDEIIKSAKFSIIFGGNYFTDLLPVGRHWFVWDKKNTMPTFSDCELAWSNIDRKSVKLITYEYNGLIGKREKRVHPTQKPVAVMSWIIKKLPNGCQTILDPFMGSGTTGVACAKLGLSFIGIERDNKFFDDACLRIEQTYQQPDFFVQQPKETQKQSVLL